MGVCEKCGALINKEAVCTVCGEPIYQPDYTNYHTTIDNVMQSKGTPSFPITYEAISSQTRRQRKDGPYGIVLKIATIVISLFVLAASLFIFIIVLTKKQPPPLDSPTINQSETTMQSETTTQVTTTVQETKAASDSFLKSKDFHEKLVVAIFVAIIGIPATILGNIAFEKWKRKNKADEQT